MDDLQTPPTEAEVADLCSRLPSAVGGIVRRLAFQRDTLANDSRRLRALVHRLANAYANNCPGITMQDELIVEARDMLAGPIQMPVEPTEERK